MGLNGRRVQRNYHLLAKKMINWPSQLSIATVTPLEANWRHVIGRVYLESPSTQQRESERDLLRAQGRETKPITITRTWPSSMRAFLFGHWRSFALTRRRACGVVRFLFFPCHEIAWRYLAKINTGTNYLISVNLEIHSLPRFFGSRNAKRKRCAKVKK